MNQKSHRPKVLVGLRYDDYSAQSPTILESQILEACARLQAPCTFGMIPKLSQSQSSEVNSTQVLTIPEKKWEMLRMGIEQGILEVALHGLTHLPLKEKAKSEFRGLSLAVQTEMLMQGKAIIEREIGPIQTFIPPWNSYDRNTLAAIKTVGLKVISASVDGPVGEAHGPIFLPATCLIENLKMAVERAFLWSQANPDFPPVVIGYFHPFDFKEADPKRGRFTFQEFEAILKELKARPGVEIKTLGRMSESLAFESEAYERYSRISRFTPGAWEKFLRPVFWAYPYPMVRIPVLGRLLPLQPRTPRQAKPEA